uniref:Putative ovule protein n=1 Tax=Solanum chacoense TaxID=4108 RepID=A0A0V0GPA9_SOLCH
MAPISAPPPKANTPKSSPVAEAPAEEEEAEAPAPSKDADAPAGAPDADAPPADQAPPPSSAAKLKVSFGLFVVLATIILA